MIPPQVPWESANFFKQIIESARNTSLIVTDLEGIIRFFSPGAEALLGYTAKEMVGLKSFTILHPPEETKALIQECAKGTIEERVWTYIHKSGRRIPVSLHFSPITNSEGTIEAYVGVVADISHPQEKELLIQKKMDELKLKNQELEGFTYTVSHDLKSPLLTIKGFLGAIFQDLSNHRSDRLEPDLMRIMKATDHMQGLLEALLELSRIGRITNPPSHINMGNMVRSVLENLTAILTDAQAEVKLQGDLGLAWGDGVRISEVWQNLIENSLKYRRPQVKCEITIGYRLQDKAYFVRDNGAGLPLGSQERIFNLFCKLNTYSEGTGIGLALVKKIINYHGGQVWAESPGPEQGCCVYFTLSSKPESTLPLPLAPQTGE